MDAPNARPADDPLLPPELPWVYALMPLPAAYLLNHDSDREPAELLVELLKLWLPFLIFGGTFQRLYAYFVPGWSRALRS